MSPLLLRYGERGWLMELADGDARRAWHAALHDAALAGILDAVPAARTVHVLFESEADAQAAEPALRALGVPTSVPAPERHKAPTEIPVRYDGTDLLDVAQLLGVEPDEVVERHLAQEWFVDFLGFLPGFAYLVPAGAERPLRVPRRASPRASVPPGSVGLADEFTGVYPQASPGGWQLIGRTAAPLWDQHRDPPSLLSPSDRVRFIEASAHEEPVQATPAASAQGEIAFTVLATGAQLLIQDLGRPGHAHLAVSSGGAADRQALRRGNRLLGNPEGTAGLENLLGGARLRSELDQWVCLTGAPGPVVVGSRPVAHEDPFWVRAGEGLLIGPASMGLRRYLCRRGGVGGASLFGSLSTDPVSGLGPPPLTPGEPILAADVDPVGQVSAGLTLYEPAQARPFRLHPGPRADWVVCGIDALVSHPWTISSQLDRIGVRLSGPALARARGGELPSEGIVRGAVQVPPSGQPIVFGPDHPTTGGYPVIACVAEAELDRLAQLRPGEVVSFCLR